MCTDQFELNIDEHLRPSVERRLTGTTKADSKIAALNVPTKPTLSKWAIILLRTYRKYTPTFIKNQCVYEPSCSHYSELAIREYGLLIGVRLTIKRLYRCRPNSGGIDFPCDTKEQK